MGTSGKTLIKHGGVKWFKVNYTRKIQHFAAYAVPVFVHCDIKDTPAVLAWSDLSTLAGFLLTIKPIRELNGVFMMQFNSYDRPEDRPHTIKWIVLGDVIPGMAVIVVYYAIIQAFGFTVNGVYSCTDLAYIYIMICGLGDGLA